jgi:ribosomal protein S1
VGQVVRARILEVDRLKQRLKLSLAAKSAKDGSDAANGAAAGARSG